MQVVPQVFRHAEDQVGFFPDLDEVTLALLKGLGIIFNDFLGLNWAHPFRLICEGSSLPNTQGGGEPD